MARYSSRKQNRKREPVQKPTNKIQKIEKVSNKWPKINFVAIISLYILILKDEAFLIEFLKEIYSSLSKYFF